LLCLIFGPPQTASLAVVHLLKVFDVARDNFGNASPGWPNSGPGPFLSLSLQKLPFLHPPCLQPLRQLVIILWQVYQWYSLHIDMEFVPSLSAQIRAAQGLPYCWCLLKFMVVFICDRHVVYGYNMLCLPQMLHSGDETLRSGIEEMFRDRPVVLFAPYSCCLGLLRCVSCCFAEADKP